MPSLSNLELVRVVDLDRDWNELFGSWWKAWSIPRQAPMVATFPHIGEGNDKEVAAFALKKAQYLASAKTSPGQMWFKLIDKEQSPPPIVGGCCFTHWKDENDPKNMPDKPYYGFAPGSQLRMMCEQLYGQLDSWHRRAMQGREHVCRFLSLSLVFLLSDMWKIDGHAMWILPEYRNLHAAPLMTDMYEQVIDELDVEAYTECVELSVGTLKRAGSVVLNVVNFPMQIENPSEESQELMDDFLSEPIYLMWRPRRSDKNGVRPSVGMRESKL